MPDPGQTAVVGGGMRCGGEFWGLWVMEAKFMAVLLIYEMSPRNENSRNM